MSAGDFDAAHATQMVHRLVAETCEWFTVCPAMLDYSVDAIKLKTSEELQEVLDEVHGSEEQDVELVDVLICLLRRLHADSTFRQKYTAKMTVNRERTWEKQADGVWHHV